MSREMGVVVVLRTSRADVKRLPSRVRTMFCPLPWIFFVKLTTVSVGTTGGTVGVGTGGAGGGVTGPGLTGPGVTGPARTVWMGFDSTCVYIVLPAPLT